MSRLEELIQKQRQFPIVDLHTVVKRKCSGATPAKGNREYYDGGNIPWLRTQDVRFNEIVEVESYITEKAVNETAVKWIPENCVIIAISGASAGRCAINKIRTTTNQHCLNLEIDSSKALYKYIYYCIANQYQELLSRKQGARGDLNSSLILSLKIPLPPLEVQREIVRILDHFTELTTELATELAARKKQYEYYRDQLLTFGEDVEYKTLPDITLNCDKYRKPIAKGKRTQGTFPYYGASGIVDYVADYIFDGNYLLVSEDGANLLARSTPIAFSISGKNWVNNHAHVLKFDSLEVQKFVEYYLNSIDLTMFISGGAQPKLNQDNLNKILIPFPSMEKICHTVDVLSKFDTLCNDLTAGLPAEIEARQKQYEYYRDKLLDFQEIKS